MEATELYASYNGEWVAVPLGSTESFGWTPRTSIPDAVNLSFTGAWVNNTVNIPPNFQWSIENDSDGQKCIRFQHSAFTLPANAQPPIYEMRSPIPGPDTQEMFNTRVNSACRWVSGAPQYISYAYVPAFTAGVAPKGTSSFMTGTQGSAPAYSAPTGTGWHEYSTYQGSMPVVQVNPTSHEYLLRFYPTYYFGVYASGVLYPACDYRVRISHLCASGYTNG
ncbi:MAG: hypothetical protein ACOYB3_04950 [Azonexus sp.]